MTQKFKGLTISRVFTQEGVHPFDGVTWEKRDAVIKASDGRIVFERFDVEVPSTWSVTATNIVCSKYLQQGETSIKELLKRVAGAIAERGFIDGYFATHADMGLFEAELLHLLLHQMMSFNSPVWFNVGVHECPQSSACFINSVDDSMSAILELCKTEGMLFKFGSGSGVNLSTIRSSQEPLSGGGKASGPLSFMRGLDAFAGAIKSGGTTRRAAAMRILNVDHPDIEEFISCKVTEELKAHALIREGYDPAFNAPGGAYDSISFQNANHSVRVTDAFMLAADAGGGWTLKTVKEGRTVKTVEASDLLWSVARAAWECGDPGLQFHDTTNQWNTVPASGTIHSSNPCSEFVFLDDTACNLASLNLRKFQHEDGTLKIAEFRDAVHLTILAQEILVGMSSYPTEKIAQNSEEFRPLGLGYANLGAFLMAAGLPYDSDEGRVVAAAITALMTGAAYEMSARIAAEATGPFSAYAANSEHMIGVIAMHKDALSDIESRYETVNLNGILNTAEQAWTEAICLGQESGFRNAQVTVLAPTGTIAFMMDCDTTGVEPALALVSYKTLVGGGNLKIVNGSVHTALEKLGYEQADITHILQHIETRDTIEGCNTLDYEHLEVFDCALCPSTGKRSITWRGHVRMMSAVQPFLSGAISKTINLPANATVEDVYDVYMNAWASGLKAVAVYRDGCKSSQPLSTSKAVTEAVPQACPAPTLTLSGRKRLPTDRAAVTHKFAIAGHEGYLTVGMYPDGTLGEIFVRMAKEGSTLAGLMDAFATSVSIALQHGVPLGTLSSKFVGTRFEPAGFTGNQGIPIATSIVDYLFRWLENWASKGATLVSQEVKDSEELGFEVAEPTSSRSSDAPLCSECGTLTVRSGSCHRCPNCGTTTGCS